VSRPITRTAGGVAALLLTLAAFLLYDGGTRGPSPSTSRPATGQPSTLRLGGLQPALTPLQARQRLARLPAATRTVTVPYRRDAYGKRWEDIDGNGCNQRDDVYLD
jgi:hypothetical protein